MAEKTAIAWTRSTFNPWVGCTKVGPGCDHCYAEALDKRMRYGGEVHWGAGVPRMRTSVATWKEPLRWNARAARGERPWRVFCASLADVFDNEVPDLWRSGLWELIGRCSQLDWLIVTKRIGNVARMVPEHWLDRRFGFPGSVRLLITVCNQEEADRDIPKLLALPSKNGISYEPALGPVDWSRWLAIRRSTGMSEWVPDGERNLLQWIIVGGESTQGSGKARPFDLAWARSTVAQCKAADVPVFMKQSGSAPYFDLHAPGGEAVLGRNFIRLRDRAGTDPAEWPEDLRVQEFPR